MRLLIVLIAAVFATACSPRIYPVQRDTVTQVRTEIVERLVRDTVEVALPQDSTSVRTADTTSTLAIRAATSTATVSGGVLTHALYSNPNYKRQLYTNLHKIKKQLPYAKALGFRAQIY